MSRPAWSRCLSLPSVLAVLLVRIATLLMIPCDVPLLVPLLPKTPYDFIPYSGYFYNLCFSALFSPTLSKRSGIALFFAIASRPLGSRRSPALGGGRAALPWPGVAPRPPDVTKSLRAGAARRTDSRFEGRGREEIWRAHQSPKIRYGRDLAAEAGEIASMAIAKLARMMPS